MDDDKKPNPHPQRMRWTTVLSTKMFEEARKKADAVKGKVRARPDGTFDVRVGTEVRADKDEA
jgi:hypothetical protein